MAITAPYNFVPLSKWVFSPGWAEQVWQDIPFQNGISGHLTIGIKAETPILVGNEQTPYDAKSDQPGQSRFCRINGQYAIPGTTLKGMIRNLLEIASFGKMRLVDDRRLGIRDITTGRVRENNYPLTKAKDQQAGFIRLSREQTGRAEIVPCEVAHIHHDDMRSYCNTILEWIFTKGMSVQKKYEKWRELTKAVSPDNALPTIRFEPTPVDKETIPKAGNLGTGEEGIIVFTEQISDKRDNPDAGKYRDFVFYQRRDGDVLPVAPRVLADFRFIHGDGDKHHQGSWNDFWKDKFFDHKEVPVFYRTNARGEPESIGLAYMYKLAYTHSIGETIAHTGWDHLDDDRPDLAELLFGKVHPDPRKNTMSLKSRVSFGACFAEGAPEEAPSDDTVLSNPKPTYFPNYVCQDQNPKLSDDKNLKTYHYRTYMQDDSEIRGWKRYPVRHLGEVVVPKPPQKSKTEARIKLHPLREKTRFSGTIRFQNLLPQELGALLWALEWGDHDNLRHNIGMGKPFGFGVIKITPGEGELRLNSDYDHPVPLDEKRRIHYRQQFEQCMEACFQNAQPSGRPPVFWCESEQLTQLLAMADPGHRNANGQFLRHLRLEIDERNEFNTEKGAGQVLPEYEQFPDEKRDRMLFPRNHPPLLPGGEQVPEQTGPGSIDEQTWLNRAIEEIQADAPRMTRESALTGRALAEKWSRLEEDDFKKRLCHHIREAWRECGDEGVDWWNKPVSNGMRRARKLYGPGCDE